MAVVTDFEIKLLIPEFVEPNPDMLDKWANGMKNNAGVLKNRLQAQIPDENAFVTKMAQPASNAFGNFINPSFVSDGGRPAGEIQNAHRKNLQNAYYKWATKIGLNLEELDGVEAARFKEKIENSKESVRVQLGSKILRAVGDKITGRGAGVIAVEWLIGSAKASSLLRPGDIVVSGQPTNCTPTGLKPPFKAAVTSRISQAMMAIINSDFDTGVATEQNTKCITVINGLKSVSFNEFVVGEPTGAKSGFEVSVDAVMGFIIHIWLTHGSVT